MGKKVRNISHVVLVALVLLFSACNATKFVPDNQYLLNKAYVTVTDTKEVDPSALRSYLRQQPNSEILGFWKLQLHIYNTAPADTTTKSKKRLAANAHRIGEAPEIYSEDMTSASMVQLRKAMQNKGYFDAAVDTTIKRHKKKLAITYLVTANKPYTLRNAEYDLRNDDLDEIAQSRRNGLKKGMLFDADVLNDERKRIETDMRSQGYYYFQKEMLSYQADSALGSHQVDVQMQLQPYVAEAKDTLYNAIFRTYTIRRVHFYTDYDPSFAPDSSKVVTTTDGDYTFTYYDKRLLRENVLKRNTKIKPGEVFNQRMVDRTYEVLNGLGVVKYVDISFVQVDSAGLDCRVVLARQKLHAVSAQIEGTYTSGDWGVALEGAYTNRNIFHGAEELGVKARGSYEWRANGGRAIEALVNVGLKFPNRLKLEVEGRYQDRPDEYNRIIANTALSYYLQSRTNAPWSHNFRFVDLSYVYLPRISDEFRRTFMQSDNLMKYSYEDHFIMALGYQVNYTSYRQRQPNRSYGTFSLAVETAGNVLQGISKLAKLPTDEDGNYKIGNILFSQYAKFDFMFTGHAIINEHHRFVFRGALGVAVPYGNASAIPFEKRYFAGGANGVRGWTARSLGPGTYANPNGMINYDNQAGDIRIDLSAEYRVKIWKIFHAAAFVDAGNIWTIREYESQPGGMFHFDTFYKQLGVSYGAGLRLDMNFLVLRLDLGVRLYDPALLATGKQWRTVGNGLNWNNDCALHFAIGYPF